ncbi:MAG: hypothetical protein MUF10_17870 [Thermoanaerobaculaceae bacterium]|nr:hypothetical protein [Thermoanaerobaculaceae bacterium]
MKVIGYRPSNRWVQRPLDWGWWPWLKRCCLGALALAAVLGALVAPRQTTIRIRYQIAQLTSEVERLESEHRTLLLERERLSSPSVLAGQIGDLGLIQVPSGQVAFLGSDGRLQRSPHPTPSPHPTALREAR